MTAHNAPKKPVERTKAEKDKTPARGREKPVTGKE